MILLGALILKVIILLQGNYVMENYKDDLLFTLDTQRRIQEIF